MNKKDKIEFNNKPQTCPVCRLAMLLEDNQHNYICLNCGWSEINGVEIPLSLEMDMDMLNENI